MAPTTGHRIIVTLLALIYSVAVVWGGAWLLVTLKSQPFPTSELAVLAVQTLIAFLPFALLVASKRVRDNRNRSALITAAATGFACSLLLWGYYFYDGITYDGRTGANIGLGIVMLFSPLIVYAAMHFAFNRASTSKNVG